MSKVMPRKGINLHCKDCKTDGIHYHYIYSKECMERFSICKGEMLIGKNDDCVICNYDMGSLQTPERGHIHHAGKHLLLTEPIQFIYTEFIF